MKWEEAGTGGRENLPLRPSRKRRTPRGGSRPEGRSGEPNSEKRKKKVSSLKRDRLAENIIATAHRNNRKWEKGRKSRKEGPTPKQKGGLRASLCALQRSRCLPRDEAERGSRATRCLKLATGVRACGQYGRTKSVFSDENEARKRGESRMKPKGKEKKKTIGVGG